MSFFKNRSLYPKTVLLLVGLMWLSFEGAQAATILVTSAADSGPNTLRQALIDASANDVIEFNIGGGGVQTINLLAALPAINVPITIDGTTQPGYAGTPLIELNGSSAGASVGLHVMAGNCLIRGLVVNRFAGGGIWLDAGDSNIVQNCYIGTSSSGLAASANALFGIWINGGSDGNLIGGASSAQRNVISGNTQAGIYLQASSDNIIQGNFIGVGTDGVTPVPNGNNGVVVSGSPGTVIGGSSAAGGNVISGNVDAGILISGSTDAKVQGNYIGLSADGTIGVGNTADGIRIASGSGHLIGGLLSDEGNVISANGFAGIFLADSSLCVVQRNRVGTRADGSQALGNALAGITLLNATSNRIGAAAAGNVISGNTQDGLFLTNSAANLIEGNLIGLDAAGAGSLGNQFNGITLRGSTNNTIGGLFAGAGNTISANSYEGISVAADTTGTVIQGNRIGTTPAGDGDRGNGRAGISISGPDNRIGGVEPGAGNTISGNADAGILLANEQATLNLVQGNRIGTTADGTAAIRNDREGIYLYNAGTNTIGGTVSGAGNLIAGNYTRGIFLNQASGNVIQGNLLGTQADGTSPLGQRFHAIEIEAGANNNLIGGDVPGAGNHVAHSLTVYSGVRIRDGATGNSIRGNSIFSNGGLGIDLGAYQPTPNDSCDTDVGANHLQNFPTLATATVSGSSINIAGSINSASGGSYVLDFFASPTADASGYGEGEKYLGSITAGIRGGGVCSVNWVANFDETVPAGWAVSATATDESGNTSEFCSSATATLDTTPPTPNPVFFRLAPTATGPTAVTMTAYSPHLADISKPVEFLFTETSGNPGGDSSDWQTNPTYVDDGLDPSTTYGYTVTKRDALGNTGTTSTNATVTTLAETPILPDALAIYDLDEGSGTVAGDTSGNDFDGTVNGGATWIEGHRGTALQFDGVTGHVEVPSVDEMNFGADDSFTVTAWVESPPGVALTEMVLGKQGTALNSTGFGFWELNHDPTVLFVRLDDTDGSTTGWLPNGWAIGPATDDGHWHHLVMVVDRTTQTLKMYTDGVPSVEHNLAIIGSNGIGDLGNDAPLSLGGTAYWRFGGAIDQVRIYATALSTTEVMADYAGGIPGGPPPPTLKIELASSPDTALLSWPTTYTGYDLLTTGSLTPPVSWSAVAEAPVSTNGQWVVTLPIDQTATHFYRLEKP